MIRKLLLAAVLFVSLVPSAHAGKTIVEHMGGWPNWNTLRSQVTYLRAIRELLREHWWTADYTIYVDSDAAGGGDGSEATPYNTLAAAFADANNTTGNKVDFCLKGEFRSVGTHGITDVNNYRRYRKWPNAESPLITPAVALPGATTTWTVVSGTHYTTPWTTAQKQPRYVYIKGRYWNCGVECASSAEVDTVATNAEGFDGAWYWDSGAQLLHVNFGYDLDPARVDIEVVANDVDYSGWSGTGVDYVSFWGLQLVGYSSGTVLQNGAIYAQANGSESILAYDCDLFGGNNHTAVNQASSGSGGIVSFIHCRAGGAWENGDDKSIYNGYTSGGGLHFLLHNAVVPLGVAPNTSWFDYTDAGAIYDNQTAYAHSGGADLGSVLFWWAPWVDSAPDRLGATSNMSSFQTATPYALRFGETLRRKKGYTTDQQGIISDTDSKNVISIGLLLDINMGPLTTAGVRNTLSTDPIAAALFRIDTQNTGNRPFALVNGSSSSGHSFRAKLDRCVIEWGTTDPSFPSQERRINYELIGGNGHGCETINSVFQWSTSIASAGRDSCNIENAGRNLQAPHFVNYTDAADYSNAVNATADTTALNFDNRPVVDDAHYTGASPLSEIEYDRTFALFEAGNRGHLSSGLPGNSPLYTEIIDLCMQIDMFGEDPTVGRVDVALVEGIDATTQIASPTNVTDAQTAITTAGGTGPWTASTTIAADDVGPDRTWRFADRRADNVQANNIVTLHPSSSQTLAMDFTRVVNEGSVINSVDTVVDALGDGSITLTNIRKTEDSYKAMVEVGGLTDAKEYHVTITITTTDSQTITRVGVLRARSN